MKDFSDSICNFCSKSKQEVEKLIVGDGVGICNDCVNLCLDILKDDLQHAEKNNVESFNPIKLKEYLDDYIIGQDEAKIALSVAVGQHLKRINHPPKNIEIEKTNVLILGPTGVGKTFMARKIADYLNLPFAICDATSITAAGYVGDDVETILTRLISAADGDIELASKGVVYIDEIDKIGRKSESPSITRDVGGEEVQQALLKIIEGTVVRVPMESKRKNPNGGIVEIDSKNILFICGGAFVGLEKIIEERRNKKNIGFINSTPEKINLYTGVTNKDLTTFGLIPEFIGRFSSIVSLSKLSVSDLVKILKHTKNSLIKQYQYLFELDNIKLEFDTDSLELIAEKAIELNTNARGLKNIIEKILLPYQYAATDLVEKGLTKIIINKLAVNGETATLIFDRKKNETIQK